MSAESAIKLCFDRLAKGRQTQQAVWTGDDFRTKIDAAADATFEDRMFGTFQAITNVDADLDSGAFWSTTRLRKLFDLLNSYFSEDLSLSQIYLEEYLDTKGWRVPYYAAEAYYEAVGRRLDEQYVFPKGTRTADEADPSSSGMHCFQTWVDTGGTEVKTVVDGALTNCYSVPVAISMTAAPAGASHAVTLTLSDGSTTKTVLFTPDATQYGHIFPGIQAVSVESAAAQKVVSVAATAQFAADCWVLIMSSDFATAELCQIDSIVANTSLTMESNLINTHAVTASVYPLVTNCVYQAGTLANDKSVYFYAWPDRIIAL